jgi:uncharacterized protein
MASAPALSTPERSGSCCNRVSQERIAVDTAPLGLLVIQPTPFCNIDCKYCYLGDRLNRSKMDLSTVEDVVRFLADVPVAKSPLSVVWHAGEPLVAPIEFYQRAIECFATGSPAIPAQHHFQTNATLLNDEWCRFIKTAGVCVGVSIDGPKDIHDAHRVDRAGRGTFDRVMHGIEKLREHEIPFTVISVVTRAAMSRAAEVWEFLVSLGASQLAFNIEEAEGIHHISTLSGGDLRELSREFFARITDLRSRAPKIHVRELDDMRRHMTAPPGSMVMRSNNRPGAIINIDVNGNIGTLSPELLGQTHPRYGKFHWGNVHTDSWSDVLRHPRFLAVQRSVEAGIQECKKSCGYFEICGGGNPSNKLAELGTLEGTETQYCRLHVQAIADVVLERMEKEQEIAVQRVD